MKADQLRDMTDEELRQKLAELNEELFNLRFRLGAGQLDNPMQIRAVKKDIARVKTILRERGVAHKRRGETAS